MLGTNVTPICKQLGIPKFHDIPKIQMSPMLQVAMWCIKYMKHTNFAWTCSYGWKILIQLILLALKLRSIILVATESLLYYRPLHIIIANVIMLFTDINCTSLYWIFITMAGFGLSDIQLLYLHCNLKQLVLSLAYLGNAYIQIILSSASHTFSFNIQY